MNLDAAVQNTTANNFSAEQVGSGSGSAVTRVLQMRTWQGSAAFRCLHSVRFRPDSIQWRWRYAPDLV